ncbi:MULTISPECIES: hypothetical protein [Rhodopseudomonas]|uniref:Uncharacterized protein n=1 Tax=Rhodopseudomonas palustris TaxID=1076 RepID=A0A0D7EEQ7_RHOPL|nr:MULTISPECIES: hypothetical protein [Rhodopseudomonas]KIZ38062.1 hypothetical protein OO17_23120 [Rhodopseudomonas palustris]MDF3810538.1 hypothetical protein [Rhodopseudomonas sp. BAL398]WOK18402.1 hypothetical protein RBJ75_02395 [Rhodopseudomonas sp. BAL398]
MSKKEPEKLIMASPMLNDVQKMLVVNHLWLALRQTFEKMYELNGAQVVIDMQRTLISGTKNSDTTGLPLDKEKAVIDTTITLLEGLISVDGHS